MDLASEPAPGSVIAKHEIRSPSIVGIRYRCRCSSSQKYRMLSASPPNWNGTNVRPLSIAMIAAITAPRFIPPNSSGVVTPQNPLRRAFRCRSRSTDRSIPARPARSPRSTSGSSGMTSRSMNARTVSRTCRSSSLSEKSTIAGHPFPAAHLYPMVTSPAPPRNLAQRRTDPVVAAPAVAGATRAP
jgi:hypothetical protein